MLHDAPTELEKYFVKEGCFPNRQQLVNDLQTEENTNRQQLANDFKKNENTLKFHQLCDEFPQKLFLIPWGHQIQILTKCKNKR